MEPFSKDDPLHSLLGQARPINPRPNFTQNVMRAIRNEPQEVVSFWSHLTHWLSGSYAPRIAVAALAVVFTVLAFVKTDSGTAESNWEVSSTSGQQSLNSNTFLNAESTMSTDAVVVSELDSMDHLSDLLANQDTDSFTDHQIAMLLY